jgi:ribonuclease HI
MKRDMVRFNLKKYGDDDDAPGPDSIYCDGACRGNGTARAVGGWAWAYWPGPARGEPETYGSARLADPATNQRAELMALLEAGRWWGAHDGGPITIYTDSMYTINCTTVWGPSWKKRGWSRAGGEPLQNLDLIKPLVELWATKSHWRLVHVRGHQTGSSPQAHGNNWVDRAAVAASLGSATYRAVVEPANKPDIIELVAAPVTVPPVPTPLPPVTAFPATNGKHKKPVPNVFEAQQMDIRHWFSMER